MTVFGTIKTSFDRLSIGFSKTSKMSLEKLVKWFCYEDKDLRFNPNSNIIFF